MREHPFVAAVGVAAWVASASASGAPTELSPRPERSSSADPREPSEAEEEPSEAEEKPSEADIESSSEAQGNTEPNPDAKTETSTGRGESEGSPEMRPTRENGEAQSSPVENDQAMRTIPFGPRVDGAALTDESSVVLEGTKHVRLDEAIELALARHPRLTTAREQVNMARARVGQEQSRYYPQVSGSLQYLRASENGSLASFHSVPGMSRVGGSIREGVRPHHSFNNFLAAVAVQQVIYDFGRTGGAVDAQKAAVKAVEMEQLLVKQTIAYGVIRAFYEVQASRASIAVAQDILETTRGVLELAKAAKRAGMRPSSEQARAEADVAASEVRLIRAEAQLELARAQVAFAIGAVGESFEPIEEPFPLSAAPREEDSIEVALENRPELRALDFQREEIQQRIRSVKAQQYPRIDALGSVSSRGQFLPTAGQDSYHRFNWNAGVVVSVPFFQGMRVKKEKEELQAERSSLDGGQETIRQAVILEVKQALAMVKAADAAEKASRKGVRAAEEALETLQNRYAGGLADLVELTDAQGAYLAARSQAVEAMVDRYAARALLDLAMGTLRGLD